MINTIVGKPTKTILYGAALTAVVLVIALLVVSFATGSAQAQTPPPGSSGNTDGDDHSYTNHSTYPDPQPCGPGAGDADMKEPHEITSGHYALFDAYWRTISKGERDNEATGLGVLHTNLCPPEVTQTTMTVDTRFGPKTTTETTRSARSGGMEVDEAIMHVLDKHLATTVASNAGAGQISLAEYPAVRKALGLLGPNGEELPVPDDPPQVWWLRLDDPRSTSTDEASDLSIGFSTLLLDAERWKSPMRYKFEVERHPDDPTDVPHFFAYESPDVSAEDGEKGVKLVWDSTKAGQGEILLNPGEYKDLQWVFTKPGTYLLWVHLLGEVKKPGDGDNWKAISENETETSEVYRYTIQVGSDLDETEPPIFGVNRSVKENSFGGTKVGDPIPVYNAEADVLYYDLTGTGHSNFETVVASTDPHAVQIVVADGANLDYEDAEKRSYELFLTVTDRVDHEHNFDPSVDDVLIVRIDLEDREPGLQLRADQESQKVGKWVNFAVLYEQAPEHAGRTFGYQLEEHDGPRTSADRDSRWPVVGNLVNARAATWSVPIEQSSAGTKTYRATVVLSNGDSLDTPPTYVNSNDIEITWVE